LTERVRGITLET